jgi:CheY-like chemotaxis protein
MSLPTHVVILNRSTVYADIIRGHLAFEGYRITALTAPGISPTEVLALCPDLIVLDLVVADNQRGVDFLRQLRQEPAGREVPVLLSTPGGLIDAAQDGAELAALSVTVIEGFTVTDRLVDAARDALARPPDVRRAEVA